MSFEERLLEIRKNRSMSQETLAEKIGVSRQAVSKWETGEALPDYTKLVALADALEVSLDYLCGRVPQAVESVDSSVESTKKRQRFWLSAIAIAATLIVCVAGLWTIGKITNREQGTVEPAVPYLPDMVEVSGLTFSKLGRLHTECRFVSNIVGEQYDYQIHFEDGNGRVQSVDAKLEGGFYSGMIQLPNGRYSVSVTVSNGVESRAALLTWSLEVDDHMFTWQ